MLLLMLTMFYNIFLDFFMLHWKAKKRVFGFDIMIWIERHSIGPTLVRDGCSSMNFLEHKHEKHEPHKRAQNHDFDHLTAHVKSFEHI